MPNPYDDDYSKKRPNVIPYLRRLSTPELQRENVDTPQEIQFGLTMSNQRNMFLQRLVSTADGDRKFRNNSAPHFVTGSYAILFNTIIPKPIFVLFYMLESGSNIHLSQRQLQGAPKDERSFLFYVPSQDPTKLHRRPEPRCKL